MGLSFSMYSVAGKSKKDARITGSVGLDTRMLLDFADEVNYRSDQPEDSSLDWIEGCDLEDGVSPRDCYPAREVLSGLRWLNELAAAGDKSAASVWKNEWRMKEPFTPEAFRRAIEQDLKTLISFCEAAESRKEKLIGGFS